MTPTPVVDMPRGPLASVRRALPKGQSLTEHEWQHRHRVLVAFLVLNAVALPIHALLSGYPAGHVALHTVPLLAFALLASTGSIGRSWRSASVSMGLLTAAALLVHATEGRTEAHFYFFVMLVLLTVYEDWLPFLLAIAFVLVHHGLVGTLDPVDVYSNAEAQAEPWKWAGIHAIFVSGAGVAAVMAWRFNENLREEREGLLTQLAELARTDGLTGLPNRRVWEEYLPLEIARAGRFPLPLTVGLIDIDDFKGLNDSLGHAAGDAFLKDVAVAWRAVMRETDLLARLGGDEFAVMLPNCDLDDAELLMERLLSSVPDGRSCSIGLARWDGRESGDELLARADRALYEAKSGGRNQQRVAPVA
jgi:diguanylate cyclase (GGDEF)-like protein